MRFVSNRAIVMRPLLAALASVSLFSQLCMSGCAVGPSYRRPAATLGNFHSVGAHAAHPTRAPAPALEAWWDGFNDPMLSRIVQQARDQNLDLAAALARVQQARAAAREAGAQLLPTFDVNGQATRIHYSLESPVGQIAGPLPGFRSNQSIYDAGLSAMCEFDLFGGLRRGRDLAASNARIGQALADYYPKISLAGLLGYESSRPSDLFKAATFQPQGVVGLRWRVFDFGKVSAQVTQARGANAEALARYQQAVLRAAEDVENAFTSLVQLEAHQQELLTEVAALKRARDASQEAYQGCVIALTDVLDADRQLLTAQDELAQTRADSARAAVGTFRALGGGW